MKADVSVLTFKNSLNKVSKVASKHLSLPILSCLLIRAENERMYISATNLELGVEVSLPAKIETPGTIAVQADVITNIISQIKDDTHLTIELNSDGNLVLNSKLFKGTLNIVDHEDFPTIPSIQNPTGSLNIKSSEFTNVCKSVLYSGSVSSIKPELSSVLFYIDDNNLLTAVTTDLFRLAEKKVSFIKQQSFDKVLISIKNIIEIIRIIGEGKSDIEILVKDNQVVCLVDDVYIISRTVDSNFPDYKQIIPKEYKTEVVLLKNDLLHVLQMSKIFTDKLQHLKFSVKPSDKLLTISLKNNEVGESVSNIPVKAEGESLQIAFNFKYIYDVLHHMSYDSIRLEFNGVGKPVVVKGVNDNSFLYLVMPLIINNNE